MQTECNFFKIGSPRFQRVINTYKMLVNFFGTFYFNFMELIPDALEIAQR